MKDEKLFIEKFNKIVLDVGKKYQPTSWTMKVINDTLDDIILELDDDIDVVGIRYLKKKFKKDLKKNSDLFRRDIDIPVNGTTEQQEDYKFRLEFWVRVYRFIIDYLEWLEKNTTDNNTLKLPVKYYAFYHWIKILANIEMPFERNVNDRWPKSVIVACALERYPEIDPVSFYQAFKDMDMTRKEDRALELGRGYKDKIIALSKNDARIIKALKKYPN